MKEKHMHMDNRTQERIYAERWQSSSKLFADNNYYKWMIEKVKPYKTILELGCGVGYSTLSLTNDSHMVLAVEKNHECVMMAKDLLYENGRESEVSFLEGDIIDETFRNDIIEGQTADVVICWNPGTQMDIDSLRQYIPFMLEYGLTLEQIKENPASSYTEMLLWNACKIAKAMNIPIHIIDRVGELNESLAEYYKKLGFETGFSHVQFDTMEGETVSDGGVPLVSQGILMRAPKIPIYFVSVLFI